MWLSLFGCNDWNLTIADSPAGDNFIRQSGDSVKMLKAELMCWEAYNQGKDISLQSNPTQALLIEQVRPHAAALRLHADSLQRMK